MHIVHFTSVHAWNDVRIYHKYGISTIIAGGHCTIIAPGAINGCISGVEVCGVPRPKRRLQRLLGTGVRVYKQAHRISADIYQFHDPELIPFGLLLALAGRRVLFDVHEDYPAQVLHKTWLPSAVRRTVASIMRTAMWFADITLSGVICATPAIARRFSNPTVVQNFPDIREFSQPETMRYRERRDCIAYVGGITVDRGARVLLEALEYLGDDCPFTLLLAGGFSPRELYAEMMEKPGWQRVEYHPWLGRSEMVERLTRCRAGILLYQKLPNHVESQPNKMYEYLAAGIPVIASDFSGWRNLLESYRCGIVVDPYDSVEIARAIEWVFRNPREADEMGARGRALVMKELNWSSQFERAWRFYKAVCGFA